MVYLICMIMFVQVLFEMFGDVVMSNCCMIYKFIVFDVLLICQLLMGMMKFEFGSLWNMMLCYMYEWWMEVYFYFNFVVDVVVFYLFGELGEMCYVVVYNEQVVILLSWLIYFGVGMQVYMFIWGMVGENQVFKDMDYIVVVDLC